MQHETRTADDIERDIADERSQMSSTLNDLQRKFSVDAILDDLGHMTRGLGDDLGRTLSATAGRNPAAVVVVGVGLAWLFLGQNRNHSANAAPAGSERGFESRRSLDQKGHESVPKSSRGNGALGKSDAWFAETDDQRDQAAHTAKREANGLKSRALGATHAVGDAVSNASSSLGDVASDLSDRLTLGLEDMTEAAKARVVSARRAAHDARAASEAAISRGAGTAANVFKDQPLVVGALAVALGAVIGSLLPHTRLEDDSMGAHSDQLFADAQAVYREERDKAMAALKGAAADAKDEIADIGSEMRANAQGMLPEGKTLGEAVVDRAADATKRVYDGAKDNFEPSKSDSENDGLTPKTDQNIV